METRQERGLRSCLAQACPAGRAGLWTPSRGRPTGHANPVFSVHGVHLQSLAATKVKGIADSLLDPNGNAVYSKFPDVNWSASIQICDVDSQSIRFLLFDL